MDKFNLNNYGNIVASQSYIIDTKNSIIEIMEYNDYLHNISIDAEKNYDESYTVELSESSNKICERFSDISIRKDLHHIFRKKDKPILYNWNGSSTRTPNNFNVELKCKNKSYDMTFSRYKNLFLYDNIKSCDVYEGTRIVECYDFLENGYMCNNVINKMYTCLFKDKWIEFKLLDTNFLRNINDIVLMAPSLYIRPCVVQYFEKDNEYFSEEYRMTYDNRGLINKCICTAKPKVNLAYIQYNINGPKKYNIVSKSLAPLLFDAFNFEFIDEPLKYYSLSTISYMDLDFIKYDREIYRIHEDKIEKLISQINSKDFSI